jgi:hypothetical protein
MSHLVSCTTTKFDSTKVKPNPCCPIGGKGLLQFLRDKLTWIGQQVTAQDAEDRDRFVLVKRRAMLRAVVVLFAAIAVASAGESKINGALLAAAQKAMPRSLGTDQMFRALQSGLWNSNRTALAVSVAQPKATVVLVFLRQTNGTYLASDASGVEGGNFGKLGRRRTDYERFETTPVEWLHREDGRFQVRMRTRAWRGGQRYTTSEDLLIEPDGTVLYR